MEVRLYSHVQIRPHFRRGHLAPRWLTSSPPNRPTPRFALLMKSPLRFLVVLSFLLTAFVARATIGTTLQMQLGNPSGATADSNNHARFLSQRAQFAMDYSDNNREPNWVAWDLTSTDVGSSGRSNF